MGRFLRLVVLSVAAILGWAPVGQAARLDVVYTGDVRGTLGVCG